MPEVSEASARAGTYLFLSFNEDDWAEIDFKHEGEIDAAVEKWLTSANTADTLLQLDMMSGGWIKVLASRIQSWQNSTPETRRGILHREMLSKLEAAAFREELKTTFGWVDDDS